MAVVILFLNKMNKLQQNLLFDHSKNYYYKNYKSLNKRTRRVLTHFHNNLIKLLWKLAYVTLYVGKHYDTTLLR